MMKTLALTLLLAVSCSAGELYQHVQSAALDVYVDSAVQKTPDIPGLGDSYYSLSVSLATPDDGITIFGVYIRVQLADGTVQLCTALVPRSGYGANGSDTHTVYTFQLGENRPVKILAFNVTRFHQESVDQLIHP